LSRGAAEAVGGVRAYQNDESADRASDSLGGGSGRR
jgi:hypothetical protein